MSYGTTTITFTDGMQATSARLNEIASGYRLGSEAVDGTTVTLSSGTLAVGVISASNIGADAVTTAKVLDRNITGPKIALNAILAEHITALTLTGSLIAETTIGWTKTLTADRATQADMQSATASHFVSPDVLKYHPGVAKAYGTVSMENGVTTITGGYNVSGATDTGGESREITLSVTMANTAYIVLATGNGGGSPLTVTGKTTTKFTIEGSASASGRNASFIVFGQLQAS